jgi:hypothetical protein
LTKGAACPSTGHGLPVLKSQPINEECKMSATTKKVAIRGWSFEKFADAVKRMGKRLSVQIKSSLLQKAYDDGLSVRAAFDRCSVKKKTETKKAA